MSYYQDIFIDSRHRRNFPYGTVYNFDLHSIDRLSTQENYLVVLQQAIVSNQADNVFLNVNNAVYWRWVAQPVGFDADTTQHSFTLKQGNYSPTTLASTLESQINSSMPAQWATVGVPDPAVTVVYDVTQGIFIFNCNVNGFSLYFEAGDTESGAQGMPPMLPSERFMEMMGLRYFYRPFGSSTPMTFTAATATNGIYSLHPSLAGSRFVDVMISCNTDNYHSNPYFSTRVLDRVSLGNLGTITTWDRQGHDTGSNQVHGSELVNLSFELRDEWGLPFVLDLNQNVAFTLRLYPGQSSDY